MINHDAEHRHLGRRQCSLKHRASACSDPEPVRRAACWCLLVVAGESSLLCSRVSRQDVCCAVVCLHSLRVSGLL